MVDIVLRKFEVYVLGLIYRKGSCTADDTKLYVTKKLNEFEIDLKSDVISSTHDAAAVMVSYGSKYSISSISFVLIMHCT